MIFVVTRIVVSEKSVKVLRLYDWLKTVLLKQIVRIKDKKVKNICIKIDNRNHVKRDKDHSLSGLFSIKKDFKMYNLDFLDMIQEGNEKNLIYLVSID